MRIISKTILALTILAQPLLAEGYKEGDIQYYPSRKAVVMQENRDIAKRIKERELIKTVDAEEDYEPSYGTYRIRLEDDTDVFVEVNSQRPKALSIIQKCGSRCIVRQDGV